MKHALELRPVTRRSGQNRFCGPAVISALTGRSTQDGSRLIRHYTGKHAVTGTTDMDLIKALNACGIHAYRVGVPAQMIPDPKWSSGFRKEQPTLARWLDDRPPELRDEVLLISAGHHWQLVKGDQFVCGQVRKVVPITHKKVHRRARVREVWQLRKVVAGDPWPVWWQD